MSSELPEPKRKMRIVYSTEFLLSVADSESCKKLPPDFDTSLLSELQEVSAGVLDRSKGHYGAPLGRADGSGGYSYVPRGGNSGGRWETRSSGSSDRDGDLPDRDTLTQDRRNGNQYKRNWQNTEHDGLLGSGVFPRPPGFAGNVPPKDRGNAYQPNRTSERYQPPRPYKAAPYSRKDIDSMNDETFGSFECSNEDRAEEEKKRRVSFELMRKEQHKALHEKSGPDVKKENAGDDIISLLQATTEKTGATSKSEKPDGSVASSIYQEDATKTSSVLPAPTVRPLVPPGFSNAFVEKKLQPQLPNTSLEPKPVYGFASGDPLRFKRAVGHKDLFYIDDGEVDFKEIIEAPLPKAPLDTAVIAHWLAIEGVQPAIPENPPIDALVAPTENKKTELGKDEGLPVDIKLPVKHVLSRELQMYFDKIAELTMSRSDTSLFKEALVSLSKDSGLHPLVPYFSFFIADEVTRSLGDLPVLFALMRVVQSLLRNPHIHIEPYLHQLMPSMITCIVAKRLGNRLSDNHWELRDFFANLVASICRRFGHVYHNLQTRLTKTLFHAFLDPHKSLTQHYGAVQGISALGPSAIRLLLLPNLEAYMQLLEPELQLEKQKNEMKRKEAWHVYGALLCAAGKCLYDRLKLFPGLLFPSTRPPLRSNKRIATNNPNKRKSSSDLSTSQPPLKKMVTDGPMNSVASAPLAATMSGTMDGFSTQLPNPGMMQTSTSGQMVENIASGASRRDQGSIHAQRVSSVLRQAWKEDQDAGHLLGSLYEVFGEAIFSFVQPPEISLFV